MLRIENLKLSPGGGPFALRNAVLHILRIPEKDLLALHILRRSIDAREGVRMVYTVEVEAADEAAVLRRCRDILQSFRENKKQEHRIFRHPCR